MPIMKIVKNASAVYTGHGAKEFAVQQMKKKAMESATIAV